MSVRATAPARLFVLLFFTATFLAQKTVAPATSESARMVLIHGATFQMGIDSAEIPHFQEVFGIDRPQFFQDELPKHSVTVADFYLDRNLVTNAQFHQFVDSNPAWRPGRVPPELDNGNYLRHWTARDQRNAQSDHPIVNINWYAANFYCHSEGKRLPTEAEWEYAARAGAHALFPWGDEPPDESRANFNDSIGGTTRVAAYPPNPFGLFDMAGNVWQFLADDWAVYSSHPAAAPQRLDREELEKLPLHPTSRRQVIRGGSYAGHPVNLWVEYRDSHPANGSEDFVGFRCAQSAR